MTDIVKRLRKPINNLDRGFIAMVREAADEIEGLRARVAELEKVLVSTVFAINPPDRGGISMGEWNTRLKAATQAAQETLGEGGLLKMKSYAKGAQDETQRLRDRVDDLNNQLIEWMDRADG